jgi:SAM-dependent methyltransferase
VTRSFLQAEIINKIISIKKPVILDIGCFDGELLNELDKRIPEAELHGFDVNERLHEIFPKKKNFRLWIGNLGGVAGQFDLVTLSHAIMYIKDIQGLIGQIRRLLKPNGLLYIQTPDIRTSPFFIVLGDQYYYYTPAILENIYRHFGFEFSQYKSDWFPRELIGVGHLSAKSHVSYKKDEYIREALQYLRGVSDHLRHMKSKGRIGILGTTASAAFVDSVLRDRAAFFVDENKNRTGTALRLKEVLHPSQLGETDVVIIPFGSSAEEIRKRFAKEYKGHFVCL